MADYISREAAIALTDQHCFESGYDAVWMEEALKDIPAADVVEVVRCRDCKHYHNPNLSEQLFCYWINPNKDGFCSMGERRKL